MRLGARVGGRSGGAAWIHGLALVLAACGDASQGGDAALAAPGGASELARPAAASPDARERAQGLGVGESWPLHGGTAFEERYSRLDQITSENVADLALAWSFRTGLSRGHEATPLVVDGVLYLTSSWSLVFALDARTGRELWRYDPEVPRSYGERACCDVVNRGVAYLDGRVYVGSLDGRLIALDAKSGEVVWEVLTIDRERPYTITGAPRVVGDRIVIGNGGAEFGVRGYVSAYAADTGEPLWRTYTVPGDPSEPFESPALERAAATWKGGEWWKVGGGGTVWDSMAYDAELDLLYVGTGNGSPWTRQLRSPGGGDNLYLSSILALRPADGSLVWHYQTTPGDTWDFTATQHIILADLEIEGRMRKVLMQAPKNGFFYVIDRVSGALISAEKYVPVTWASHVDPATGRPVEVAGQDYAEGLALVRPTPFGGHNWQPMSFNPDTGLVYIPAQDILGAYRRDPDYEYRPESFNTGTDFNVFSLVTADMVSGHLLAWDPVAQREVWRQPHPLPWNGGTLTTAGNLVFQGTADGRFGAYRASDGQPLWQTLVQSGVIAAPMTYQLDGRQYVAVLTGFGGAYALAGGPAALGAKSSDSGELRVYALRGPLPEASALEEAMAGQGGAIEGERLYHAYCARCHGAAGVSAGVLPDLRDRIGELGPAFQGIVRGGALEARGMPGLGNLLSVDEVERIRAYLESRRSQ